MQSLTEQRALPGLVGQLRPNSDENLWRIYGLGEVGINEGQIFTNWNLDLLEVPPEDAKLVRHGLDYGYTNDPSAVVDVYRWNQAIILDEVLYATGQSNRMVANAIRLDEGWRLSRRTAAITGEPGS